MYNLTSSHSLYKHLSLYPSKVSALFCLLCFLSSLRDSQKSFCLLWETKPMADDWDLHAVVRGCSAVSSSATTATTVFSGGASSHTSPLFTVERQRNAVVFGEIRDLYTPFTQESNVSVVSSFSCLNYPEESRQRQNQKRPLSLSASSGSVTSKPTGSNTSRSKRRFDFFHNFRNYQKSLNLLSNPSRN